MKKVSSILWGIALIALGVVFALNALQITDIDIFFDGWWTLFILVPSVVSLFTGKDKTGSVIGILIGVFLLLCCQDVLEFEMLWKLAVPAVIIVIGFKLIFGGIFGGKRSEIMKEMQNSGAVPKNVSATFSSQNVGMNGEYFTGAELNAVFGGVNLDLRGAVIDRDCVINATSIFGGIDIFLPDTVNVKVNSNSVFGGVSDKKHQNSKDNAVTVYVNGTCMFGGVDIQ